MKYVLAEQIQENEDYGTIEYDDAQGTWVVWIKELGDGIIIVQL